MREELAEKFAAIGVMPKAADERHEPGRVKEAFKAGWDAREAEVKRLSEEVERLRGALEELRDAACTAVNWKAVIEAQVGDAPWISHGDANDVELAVLKANDALAARGKE